MKTNASTEDSMAKIIDIIGSCTVKISSPIEYEGKESSKIRIAGLYPPKKGVIVSEEVQRIRKALVGKEVRVKTPLYALEEEVLVADVSVENIDLKELFKNRIYKEYPRIRAIDPEDIRRIRNVEGIFHKRWNNPIRRLEKYLKPDLDNSEFPDDYYSPQFDEKMKHISRIYCEKRKDIDYDKLKLDEFITNHDKKIMVAFGDCGSGKSWFIRWELAKIKDKYDIGIIDIGDIWDFNELKFQEILQSRLGRILSKFVNNRTGGLHEALKFHLDDQIAGIFSKTPPTEEKKTDWCNTFLKKLAYPEHIVMYNMLRLESYAYYHKKLIILIDNIDVYCPHDEGKLLNLIIRITVGYNNVLLIIPMRPQSDFYYNKFGSIAQTLIFTHNLSNLKNSEILRQRMLISVTGKDLSDTVIQEDTRPFVPNNYFDLYKNFVGSSAYNLIENLTQSDIRHFLRLLRRHIFSDRLNGLENVGSEYYCIGSLMLKPDEKFTEKLSYIINIFDNDKSDETGNALIRWRVLEYFMFNKKCYGDFFEYYFSRLGYSMKMIYRIIYNWEQIGALQEDHSEEGKEEILTDCGKAYKHLIKNLWYCIAIKAGMNIDELYILIGPEAQKEAKQYNISLPNNIEWVSDDDFISFLIDEENLEKIRIRKFPQKIQQFETQIASQGPVELNKWLWYEHSIQRLYWLQKKRIITTGY